jgi:hypothetical protein
MLALSYSQLSPQMQATSMFFVMKVCPKINLKSLQKAADKAANFFGFITLIVLKYD